MKLLKSQILIFEPLVLSKMANIATYDYVYCINHESFAFKDLKSGEKLKILEEAKVNLNCIILN